MGISPVRYKTCPRSPCPSSVSSGLIRDACSTKGAQRELLYALGLRCNPAKKFLCFPSYAQLAEDTQLDPATLKKAAKVLEDNRLIKRVIRKNRSNVFFINVPLLQEQAAIAKASKLAALEEMDSPFDDPQVPEDRDDNDEDVDVDDSWNVGGAR